MSMSVSLTGFDETLDRLRALPGVAQGAMEDAVVTTGLLIAGQAKLNNIPKDQGTLLNSLTTAIDAGSATRVSGRMGTSLEYGVVMEFGRKPGEKLPPLGAIMAWLHHKGWTPRTPTAQEMAGRIARAIGRKRGGKQPPVSAILAWVTKNGIKGEPESLARAAYRICWSIKKRGIAPRHFLRNAVRDVKTEIGPTFARAFALAIKERLG